MLRMWYGKAETQASIFPGTIVSNKFMVSQDRIIKDIQLDTKHRRSGTRGSKSKSKPLSQR
jgi:hypothetical protein